MKTATAILFALCFGSLVLTGLGATGTTGETYTLTVTDSDGTTAAATATNFPLSYTVAGGTAASVTSGPSGTIKGTIGATDALNTVTLTYAGALPLISTYSLTSATTATPPATGSASDTIIVVLSIGSKVVTVANGNTAGSSKTSAATITTQTTASSCADYFWDSVNGLLYFAVNAAASSGCVVTVTQVNAAIGVIQYNENTFTGSSSLASQISATAAAAVSGTTAMVTGTAPGSTLVYFAAMNSGTALTSAQATTVAQAIQAAIYAKTYTVTGSTQLNGYSIASPSSASGNTNSPKSTVASNINNAYPKSHSRMVAIVGVFTTVLAAFFGLAF